MSVPLTGAGGLFVRFGHLLGAINAVNLARGTTIPPHVTTIFDDYTSVDEYLIQDIFTQLDSFQSADDSFIGALAGYASGILQEMVAADGPQPSNSLVYNLNYIIVQMKATSQTVNRSIVGESWTANAANIGNGVLAVSLIDNQGLPLENVYAEEILFTTSSDAQSGGETPAEETLEYLGDLATSDTFNWLWPTGSGASGSLTAVDPTGQQSQGTNANWLSNSDFETFTVANIPDGWTVDVGTAGTTILQSNQAYDGASSVSFVGNGAELTSLYQAFNSATGTSTDLVPLPGSAFVFNLWAKTSVAPAAGVLEIALTDGSGTITLDANGAGNVVTQSLTTLGTSFTPINGFFRTPYLAPASGYRLRVRLSTALSSGATLFLDRLSFAQPTALYSQGPKVAFFSGNVNTILNDNWTITTTNTPGKFQQAFNQLFGTASLLLSLPSSTTPTIPDSLIV